MARDKNEYAWLPQLCKANYCLECSGLVQILHFSAWTVKASSGQHHATVASMCRRHEARMLSFCRFPVPRSKCIQFLQITCHKGRHHVPNKDHCDYAFGYSRSACTRGQRTVWSPTKRLVVAPCPSLHENWTHMNADAVLSKPLPLFPLTEAPCRSNALMSLPPCAHCISF